MTRYSALGARLSAALVLGAVPGRLWAQDSLVIIRPSVESDTTVAGVLPPEILRQVVQIYNDSATIRFGGSFALPRGARLEGRVAVYRGNLRVNGTIAGPVLVINGDVIIGPGGTVLGPVLVTGGRIDVRPGGRLDGERTAYDALAPVFRMPSGRLEARERRKPLGEIAAVRTSFQTGRINTKLSLETGQTYNRVEGLPIVFGPSFTTQGSDRADARLDLRGIFRPTSDRTKLRDDVGFVVSTEWRAGRDRRWLSFGGRGYRQIQSIEDQPLTKGEAGWSAFLFQRDYRDHFEARGVEGFLSVAPFPQLRFGLSFRGEQERSVPSSDPVSLFRNQDTWRPNPLIDDGFYRTARVSLDYDTRNEPARPSTGWKIHADVERSRSDDASPVALPAAVRPPIEPGRYAFSKARFDLIRYARFNPSTRVNVRLMGAGWVGGDPLPVQRRVSLGGPDILPGFGFRDLNCAPPGFSDQSQASLCDRMLAAQIEIRTSLPINVPFRIRNAELAALQQILGIEQAELVVLADAGRAWLTGEGPGRVPNNRIPKFGEWDADVGVGIDAGGVGLYVVKAVAVSRSLRFVLRLQRRF